MTDEAINRLQAWLPRDSEACRDMEEIAARLATAEARWAFLTRHFDRHVTPLLWSLPACVPFDNMTDAVDAAMQAEERP